MTYITLYKKGDITHFNPFNIFYGAGMNVKMMMPHFMCMGGRVTKIEYFIHTNMSCN